jgi:hypothetical protein
MTAKKKPTAKKPAAAVPAAPVIAPDTATHVANHVHGGPACTDDSVCVGHPGPRLHCFEIHVPFIGTTVCSCVHAVT